MNLFISFVRQRKADLLVAARLMREAYQAGDLPVSVWAEVELRVALTGERAALSCLNCKHFVRSS